MKRFLTITLVILATIYSSCVYAVDYVPSATCADHSAAATGCTSNILTSIGSTKNATIIYKNTGTTTTTYTFTGNVTFPSNVRVVIEKGALISRASGKVATYNGPIDAGLYQTQTGLGTSVYGAGSTEYVPWQWEGAVTGTPSNITTNTTAIQKAIDSAGTTVPSYASVGTWTMNAPIYMKTGYKVIGAGRDKTIIKNETSTAVARATTVVSVWYPELSDMTFQAANTNTHSQIGIFAVGFREGIISNVTFKYFQKGVYLSRGEAADPCYYNHFINVICLENDLGVDFSATYTPNNNKFTNLHVHTIDGLWTPTATVAGTADNGSGLIRIETTAAHGYATGKRVRIYSVTGTTEANGSWIVTNVDATHFDLDGSTFLNAWVSGGTAAKEAIGGVRIAGYGNSFTGTRIGGGYRVFGLQVLEKSGDNIFNGLYIESSPYYGIYSVDISSRTNFIYGLHFDGTPVIAVYDAYGQNNISGTDYNHVAAPVDEAGYTGIAITTNKAYGGSGYRKWMIAGGQNTASSFTFTDGNVTTASNNINATHGLLTGNVVRVYTDATIPTGITAGTKYYIIKVDADNFKLASTKENALAGVSIDITNAGSGTNTVYFDPPVTGSLAIRDLTNATTPVEVKADAKDHALAVTSAGVQLGSSRHGGGMIYKIAEGRAVMSGATTVITMGVPTGCRLLGAQFYVTDTITGAGVSSWAAAYSGGSTTALVTGQALTAGTVADKMHVDEITTNTTHITVTATGGNMTGGYIRAIIHYVDYNDIGS